MRLHRFYVPDHELTHDFWLNKPELVGQWSKVLRYRPGDQVVLFDGEREDRMYKIIELEARAAKLELVTEMVRQVPAKDVYLCFALLKKDKNEWVLQKGTELGVSHFIPMITERTEKTGFDEDRARKIAIEASEQCGRSDIPHIREPQNLKEVTGEYADVFPLFVCEQGGNTPEGFGDLQKLGVLIGPEGGWAEGELELFQARGLPHLGLGAQTLRAETACLAAISKIMV